jgi:hypothetical protein
VHAKIRIFTFAGESGATLRRDPTDGPIHCKMEKLEKMEKWKMEKLGTDRIQFGAFFKDCLQSDGVMPLPPPATDGAGLLSKSQWIASGKGVLKRPGSFNLLR